MPIQQPNVLNRFALTKKKKGFIKNQTAVIFEFQKRKYDKIWKDRSQHLNLRNSQMGLDQVFEGVGFLYRHTSFFF